MVLRQQGAEAAVAASSFSDALLKEWRGESR